jgi:hypothetical protein
MRTESERHKEVREKIAKQFNGINQDSKARVLKGYYPDVRTKDTDYEIEIYNKKRHIFNKKNNWNVKRKKVLIIAIPKELKECFDEIIFFHD